MKKALVGLVLVIGLTIMAVTFLVGTKTVTETHTVTITDKEVKNGTYLIFGDTDDGQSIVFENTDTVLRLKFNSSDIHGKLKVGTKYHIKAVGYRIPWLSMYQNIIEIDKIEE